jgi:hypothetical protein
MAKAIQKRLADMRSNPKSVSFSDALAVAEHYFGEPRVRVATTSSRRLGLVTLESTFRKPTAAPSRIR